MYFNCKFQLKREGHSFVKWTRLRLYQDTYLRFEKEKREHIPIPLLETGGTPKTQPWYKTKRRKGRTLPVF
jgi:hypothetical protein